MKSDPEDIESRIEDRESKIEAPEADRPNPPPSTLHPPPSTPDPTANAPEQAERETILYPRRTYPFQESYAGSSSPTSAAAAPASGPALALDNNWSMPWAWRPLVWINCAFAAIVALAGPPGRWLAGPAGRTTLGVVGILCLLGAVGLLVADWLGWTW